jgi:hypothetical protein
MTDAPRWRRVLEALLSIGSHPGERELERAGRRVTVVAILVGSLLTVPTALADMGAGYTWVAAMNLFVVAFGLLVARRRPDPAARL